MHNRQYQFVRRLTCKRKNLSASYFAGKLLDNGEWEPLFENPKKDDLTNKAIELIGLSKEQFRQVMLLPQGQFERFLTASSTEKESILKRISVFVASFVPLCKRAANQATGRQLERMGELGSIWC